MSLKVFHIIFITLSVLLSVGFSIWSIVTYQTDPKLFYLAVGILSLVFGIALIVYEIIFIKKTKETLE